jgi:GAF domain-containing protein
VTGISSRGAWLRDLWATLAGRPHSPVPEPDFTTLKQLEIAPDEQLIGYFEQHPVPLVARGIDLASPAAPYLGVNGVSLLVPLVTQGRLVGLLSLGEPSSGSSYSRDDLAFLTTLADEAAAAARIAQLSLRVRHTIDSSDAGTG